MRAPDLTASPSHSPNRPLRPSQTSLRRVWALVGALILLAFPSPPAHANSVSINGTGYGTIQAAISAAQPGDTVLVGDGTYTGPGNVDLDLGGKAITVTSVNGAATTIIDCGGTSTSQHRGFRFQTNETSSSVVRGFTIRNGYQNPGGAIIMLSSSGETSPTIDGCVFQTNTSPFSGGAIYVDTGSPIIRNCTFNGNVAGNGTDPNQFGGAIEILSNSAANNNAVSKVVIQSCAFTNNLATDDGGAVDVDGDSNALLTVNVLNCSFYGNRASGTMSPNTSGSAGTLSFLFGTTNVVNSILYGDASAAEISTLDPPTTLNVQYSDVQGGSAGTGNKNADPKYTSTTAPYDLHLASGSPAIDVGTSTTSLSGVTLPATDHDGKKYDSPSPSLGAFEVVPIAAPQSGTVVQTISKAFTLTATDAHTPPPTLTFSLVGANGGALRGMVALSGTNNATATYTPTLGYTGPDSFQFVASNGSNNSFPATVSVTIVKADTATSLAIGPPTGYYGHSVTFTATVAPINGASGAPGGTVQFFDTANPGTPLGSGTLNGGSPDTATFTTKALSVGTHSYTAHYAGDASFNTSDSSPAQSYTVNKAPTTTTLSSTPNPSYPGQAVTYTVTVSNGDATGTIPAPTGSVSLQDGGNGFVGGTLVAGAAGSSSVTITDSTLGLGNHSLVAAYGSDTLNAASVSTPALTQIVRKAPTTTTLTSAPNPSYPGQSVTYTVTVSNGDTSGGTPAPTGQVAIQDGGAGFVGGTLVAGATGTSSVTITSSALGLGSHSLIASYSGSGDTVNAASASSPPLVQVVQKHTPTIAVTCDSPGSTATAGTSTAGTAVTFTATLGAATTPTGTVTFTIDAVVQTPIALATSTATGGTATFSTATLSAGPHTITATYNANGDANNNDSAASPTFTQTVTKATPTTGLTSSLNPSKFGQGVTFTATLTGGDSPTGTITFTVDGTAGTPVALSGGVATFTTSALSVGGHNVTATYNGDTNNAPSTSTPTLVQTVNQATSTTALVSSLNPSKFGQQVTFTATVTGKSPSSTVTFTVDGAAGTPIALNAGTASYATSGLSVGDHSVTATYNGDTNNAPSTSAPALTQTVSQATSSTALSSSPNPSQFGGSVTFTASVTGQSPTGTVTFTIDGTAGTPVALSAGTATFTTSALSVGGHTVTAAYNGDTNNAASTSMPALTQTVGLASSSTALTSSLNPSVVGQSVTFTATVTGQSPTGTVTFTIDGTAGTPIALTGGSASYATSALSVGGHTVTAAYSGDSKNLASTSSPALRQTVSQVTTATALTSSLNPSKFGQSVTFTANVTGQSPTGTVTFTIDGTAGTPVALTGGSASYATSALSVGGHNVTATYNGNTNNAPSTSTPTLVQTVNQATSSTDLTSSLNPSRFGQQVTFTATVTGQSPAGTVTFTVDGTPGTPVALSAGTATLQTSTLSVGNHSVTAAYNGDTNNAASTSTPTLTQIVNQASSATAFVSSLNPSRFSQQVTFTATVTGQSPTGTVTFSDTTTGAALGTQTLNGGGASVTTSTLSVGSHIITATYGGDTNNTDSSGAVTQVVRSTASRTTLTSGLNPSFLGQSVTFTATVTGQSPTGTVTFSDGGTVLGTQTLSGGTATLTTAGLSVGSHLITARYGGDTNNDASSVTLTQSVTNTFVTVSSASGVYGQSATLTATLHGTGSIALPGRTLTFSVDGAIVGTAVTDGTSTASLHCPLGTQYAPGPHTVTVSFGGDAVGSSPFHAASSGTGTLSVSSAGSSLTVPGQTGTPGQTVTLSARLTRTPDRAALAGQSVSFFVDGISAGTAATNGNGQASLSYVIPGSMAPGGHSITASFSGATGYGGCSGSGRLSVFMGGVGPF